MTVTSTPEGLGAAAGVPDEETVGGPAALLWPTLALTLPVMWELLTGGDAAGFILLGMPLVVIAIASRSRMRWERWLEAHDLPEREAWLPAIYILVGLGMETIDTALVWQVMGDKLPLIAFILAFALVSEGLSSSGLFHFLAFRIAERCDGSTSRLTFYLLIMASVLTAFTSNDIVVLALTPIVISVCYQARITNVRVILLATFVAANTLSMGLLIGSPSNIIVAESIGLNGFRYSFMMTVPSILAFLLTYLVISRIVDAVERTARTVSTGQRRRKLLVRLFRLPLERWDYSQTYAVPRFSSHQFITPLMVRWMQIFGGSVVSLFFVSALEWSLWWCAVPIAVAALWQSSIDRRAVRTTETIGLRGEVSGAWALVRLLPWGILYFGLSFFILAAAFSDTRFFAEQVLEPLNGMVADGGVLAGVASIVGSGLLANVFNDLPAAALLSETLPNLDHPTGLHSSLTTMGVLAGLNIGCYLTPTGALAGLIWFKVMRREAERVPLENSHIPIEGAMRIPSRSDLVRFGSAVFFGVAVPLGIILYGLVALVAYLISDVGHPPAFANTRLGALMSVVGVVLCLATVVAFRRELRARNVVIAHLRDAFVVFNRMSSWALRHPLAYSAAVAATVLLSAAGLLYWAEQFHAEVYDAPAKFAGLKGYASWLVAFMGSGYEQNLFPSSLLGIVICGLLPLLGIAVIVQLVRAPMGSSRERLRRRLAEGEAPSQRAILVGNRTIDRPLVDLIMRHSDRFVVMLSREDRDATAEEHRDESVERVFFGSLDSGTTLATIEQYNFLDAREIFLLSDGRPETDYENMRLLGALDDAAHLHLNRLESAADRLPLILFECANAEMESLLRRSISHSLAHRVTVLCSGDALGDYMAADVSSSLEAAEELYRMRPTGADVEGVHFESLDGDGVELELRDISDASHEALGSFMEALRASVGEGVTRLHTTSLRTSLEAAVSEAAERDGLRPSQVIGLELALAHSRVIMGLPAAALSSQTATARRMLVLRRGASEAVSSPVPLQSQRVHVVNASENSVSFVRALLRWVQEDRLGPVEVLLHCRTDDDVPYSVSSRPEVTVLHSADTDQTIARMISHDPTAARAGDKIYVFSRTERAGDSDLTTLRFIRSLDRALARPGAAVQQSDVYVAVESRDSTTRFLFEQLFVDKIFDTQRPRENLFGNVVELYYRIPRERHLPSFAPDQEFRLACDYAQLLRFFTVQAAKDVVAGWAPLAHMDFANATASIRQFSDPPQQVFAVASIDLAGEDRREVRIRLRFPDDDYVLEEEDRVFLISMV